MKKLYAIAFAIMFVLMSTMAFASDVTVLSTLNNPGSSVNLGFNITGTLGVTTNGVTSQNPPGSGVTPGALGQINTFNAAGNFQGTYNTSVGNYGILATYVNANGPANLLMTDHQIFDAMSGNGHNGMVGDFSAYAGGTNAAMNLKSIGSMYVYSEAANGGVALQGQVIQKQVSTTQNGNPLSNLYLGVVTDGTATMSNSTAWGWGTSQGGVATTNYNGGTRIITASGAGQLVQTGFGLNNLSFNANYTMPGGGSSIPGGFQFNNGISGTYSMSGN